MVTVDGAVSVMVGGVIRCVEVEANPLLGLYIYNLHGQRLLFSIVAGHHTFLRNNCELSSASSQLILPLSRLRRLFAQAETFEGRRLRITDNPPMRFAGIHHAHHVRALHYGLMISCIDHRKCFVQRSDYRDPWLRAHVSTPMFPTDTRAKE